MQGKTVLITGGARGMGRVTALALAEQGASLVLVDWDGEAGMKTRDDINRVHGANRARYEFCDLSSIAQVRELCARLNAELSRLDVLICNAGITWPERRFSEDGNEMHFAICHLAHFQMSLRLLPLLESSAAGRLIIISSDGHKACKAVNFSDYSNEAAWGGKAINHSAAFRAYSHAKLCNLLFMRECHQRLQGRSVTVNAVSPGFFVNTGIHREMRGIFKIGSAMVFGLGSLFGLNTPEKGARTHIWLASDEAAGLSGGQYFGNCQQREASQEMDNADARRQLWNDSLRLCAMDDMLPLG